MSDNEILDINDDYQMPSRKVFLRELDIAVQEAIQKIKSGRIYNNKNERTRIKWLRSLGYLIKIENDILNDLELEDLEKRIKKLEEKYEQ